ncbi:CDP-glycerol glycerophosphotransferase family protein [Planctomonas deserti]|uniref:CDP-glycerol glycerophosphotransferase family protein n=1 Tax=Planctomonas deserti TaxID=2144185 RepID=UPI000D357717|nr:CDP-glycerol glycerophosphotransferase family protein [Planctomonas deserti]
MGLVRDARLGVRAILSLLRQRQARGVLQGKLATAEPLPRNRFAIGVYFADSAVNLYQIRQWYRPLTELAKTWPVVILSRSPSGANELLDESPLPVAYVRRVVDLEQVIAEQELRIVFYVNQNTRNFQMMRYGRRWHVFINHGESDKMYMTTNQFKAYDYSFVAGDAALTRLGKVLWDYDFDRRAIPIGRPQADHYSGVLPYTPDDRQVILYAPTWEGDRPAAAYGSIASHGVALVRGLLQTGRHRVIYRPHPRSGVVDPVYRRANHDIIRLIEQANLADSAAQHVFDDSADLGWQLAAADVAIVDISAMVYDRLATGKPLLVTRPTAAEAQVDTGGYLSDCEWLTADEATGIVERLDALADDVAAGGRLAAWVQHYFGDTTPGAATARFHGAVQLLMDRWEEHASLHARDDSTEPGNADPRDEDDEDDA